MMMIGGAHREGTRINQVHLIGEDSDSDILHIKVDNIEHKLLAPVNVLTEEQASKQITIQLDAASKLLLCCHHIYRLVST